MSPGRSRPPPVEAPAPHSQAFEAIDRALHGDLAPLIFGLSPAVLERVYLDWLLHLAFAPASRADPDHPRLDHEVLHSRPLARQLVKYLVDQGHTMFMIS